MADRCSSPTLEEERAIRVSRAHALKAAFDDHASPLVLSGLATALLFVMANKVEPRECAGTPQNGDSCGK